MGFPLPSGGDLVCNKRMKLIVSNTWVMFDCSKCLE